MTRTRPFLRIAVLGAECTGKTHTVQYLAQQLGNYPVQVIVYPELLRIWCNQHQRTPREDEQHLLLQENIRQLTTPPAPHELPTVVLHDTAPLQTAAYHWHYFGSDALDAAALRAHQHVDLTLLMAPNMPYENTGDWQRDGAMYQMPVHQRLLYLLAQTTRPWVLVQGMEKNRLEHAWQAVEQLPSVSKPA
ncbi:MAG: ATP-binding protein [Brachymonas sp.]|nr:ATP-binding protein [Brachymonas sp.]